MTRLPVIDFSAAALRHSLSLNVATFHAPQERVLSTQVARPLVEIFFGRIDARNSASAGVLARLGMRREAHLVENEWVKGEWTDEVIYGVLAQEWARSRFGSA